MRIKNKKRFITMVTILFLVILFILMLNNKTYSKVECGSKTIYVAYGDTLWKIASEQKESNLYYEGKNVRDILEDIKYTNNLNDSYIYEGQKLEIPTL